MEACEVLKAIKENRRIRISDEESNVYASLGYVITDMEGRKIDIQSQKENKISKCKDEEK